MKDKYLNKPILESLENLELAGITFIKDYIQFLFDGPIFNAYTLPQIRVKNETITSTDLGYRDTLCSLINKKVISAYEDEKEEKIMIGFENDTVISVSLKDEDRACAEAAMLQLETTGEWNIW